MFYTLISKLFKPKPEPVDVATLDAMVDAARVEMARPFKGKRGPAPGTGGRPREHGFYDLEVGQSYRIPVRERNSTRAAACKYARGAGKKFTTRTMKNGVWVKRIA